MRAKSGSRSALGVGISTLVTIIVAVLLTTFAVLTLVTARADLRLSTRATESTQNYYAADSEAERWLADLDALVEEERVQERSPEQGLTHASLGSRLAAAQYTVQTTEDGGLLVRRSFSIDERRELVVEILIDTDYRLEVYRWQTDLKR
ncbi:MAG: hypothetical protein FWF91_07600 [Coriobacteriia bacterium]|nr:hypothetical protein [Coriobacteriia bacterium]